MLILNTSPCYLTTDRHTNSFSSLKLCVYIYFVLNFSLSSVFPLALLNRFLWWWWWWRWMELSLVFLVCKYILMREREENWGNFSPSSLRRHAPPPPVIRTHLFPMPFLYELCTLLPRIHQSLCAKPYRTVCWSMRGNRVYPDRIIVLGRVNPNSFLILPGRWITGPD